MLSVGFTDRMAGCAGGSTTMGVEASHRIGVADRGLMTGGSCKFGAVELFSTTVPGSMALNRGVKDGALGLSLDSYTRGS